MKVIFLGTPEFSLPTLEAIYNSKHDLIAIISQPDRVQDRGNKVIFSPVKEFALAHNIPILQFERISRDGVESIRSLAPDIMVTASYGQILSQELIDIPKFGIVNVHASLLPNLRGASPIQTAVIRGFNETGVTIMKTEAGLDTGDIILARKTYIGENETAGELSVRLAQMGAELLIQALGEIENGTVVYTKQSHIDAVVTKRISKEEGRIVWDKTAEQIKCQILGQNPSPIAFSFLNNVCVKFYRARLVKNPEIKETKLKPGTVIEPTSVKNGLFVQCGKGIVEIIELQFPGGRVLKASDALNGRKVKLGDTFTLNEEIKVMDAQLLTKRGSIETVNNDTNKDKK